MSLLCRSCDAGKMLDVLSLGDMPLANALVMSAHAEERRFPLALVFCSNCALLQITDTVPPEQLFTHYVYFSSFSDAMVAHARSLAEATTLQQGLDAKSLVIEAASNDGYLLQHYRRAGVPVLGVEPAANVAAIAESERGIPTLQRFFDRELAQELVAKGTRASVFHAHNVLAHVPNINDFVAGIAMILREDGIAIIEVPYAREMIDRIEFDTIYHEHVFYFSLASLSTLFERHGLTIRAVERPSIHGGSLRVTVGFGGVASNTVKQLLADERASGLLGIDYYRGFAGRVERITTTLHALISDLRNAGRKIAAYGAAAKGSTLLNFSGIDASLLDAVYDRSTHKQGLLMPGVHIPVRPSDELHRDQPAYVLLLAWNFADEIIAQQEPYRSAGGRFILPIPDVKIV